MLISCIYSDQRFASFSFASSSPSSSPFPFWQLNFTFPPAHCLLLFSAFPLAPPYLACCWHGCPVVWPKNQFLFAHISEQFILQASRICWVADRFEHTPFAHILPRAAATIAISVFVVVNRFAPHSIKFLLIISSHFAAAADNQILRFTIRVSWIFTWLEITSGFVIGFWQSA